MPQNASVMEEPSQIEHVSRRGAALSQAFEISEAQRFESCRRRSTSVSVSEACLERFSNFGSASHTAGSSCTITIWFPMDSSR
jgi:hypothetical protein